MEPISYQPRVSLPENIKKFPLHDAVKNGCIERVDNLLQKKEKINSKNPSGETPLHLAAAYDFPEIIELLLKYGADIESFDSEGRTPLFSAVQVGNYKAAQILLDHESLVAYRYKGTIFSSLHLALTLRKFEILSLLLEKGADVNIRDEKGNTPLIHAFIDWQCCSGSKILLRHKSNIDIQNHRGQTLLHLVATEKKIYDQYKNIIDEMLKRLRNVNLKDADGNTLLHLSIKKNNFKFTHALLQVQALDVNALDSEHKTPLRLMKDFLKTHKKKEQMQGWDKALIKEITKALKKRGAKKKRLSVPEPLISDFIKKRFYE